MSWVDFQVQDSCRLVPSRFPPISLYENVANARDLDAVFAIEALTNPRLRESVGALQLVPASERISGPGCSAIMAAFTHLNPEGSRFTDGSYGVYYAATDLETAVAEVSHHRERFLARTKEPALEIDMRCYRVGVQASLHELRGQRAAQAAVYDPVNYASAQALGAELRAQGAAGVIYDSVRRASGTCMALFTPRATLPPARQAEHVTLRWNGDRIEAWYLKTELVLNPR